MPPESALVLIVNYDASKAVSKFIEMDSNELAKWMFKLVEPSLGKIKELTPDLFHIVGETYRAVWFKRNCPGTEIEMAILRVISGLIQELDRFNVENDLGNFAVGLHAGLAEGNVDVAESEVSGDAMAAAFACEERAWHNKIPLTVSATIFNQLPSRVRVGRGFDGQFGREIPEFLSHKAEFR